MYPPSWMLADSVRLDLDEFGTQFTSAWSRMERRFLKLECWQMYREIEASESQAAYDRGDVDAACEMLAREAEADRKLYDDVRKRDIEYARVRLIQEPLTAYLQYELLSYRVRADLGENIEIVRCDADLRLPNEQLFDVLLFDEHTALIHDYGIGSVGLQTGGWCTRAPEAVAALVDAVTTLRGRAVPLSAYLAGG